MIKEDELMNDLKYLIIEKCNNVFGCAEEGNKIILNTGDNKVLKITLELQD